MSSAEEVVGSPPTKRACTEPYGVKAHVAALLACCNSNLRPDKSRAVRLVEALMDIAQEEDQRESLVVEGALPVLVAMLRNGGVKGKRLAAGLLDRLGSLIVEDKAAVASADTVQLLVALLQGKDLESKVNAAGVLTNLMHSPALRAPLVRAGGLHFLVTLLKGSTPQGQLNAARALCALAASPALSQQIVDAGALPLLVGLLANDDSELKLRVVLTLHNLATGMHDSKALVAAGGAVPFLVQLLGSGDSKSQLAAAAALSQLARSPELQDLIVDSGALPCLVELLRAEAMLESKIAAASMLKRLISSSHERAMGVARHIGHRELTCAEAVKAKLDALFAETKTGECWGMNFAGTDVAEFLSTRL